MDKLFEQGMSFFNDWMNTQRKTAEQVMEMGKSFQSAFPEMKPGQAPDPAQFFNTWVAGQQKLAQQFLNLGQTFPGMGVPEEVLEKWKTEFQDGDAFVKMWTTQQQKVTEAFTQLGASLQQMANKFPALRPELVPFFLQWSGEQDLWTLWAKQVMEMGKSLHEGIVMPDLETFSHPQKLASWIQQQTQSSQQFVNLGETIQQLTAKAFDITREGTFPGVNAWIEAQQQVATQFLELGKTFQDFVFQTSIAEYYPQWNDMMTQTWGKFFGEFPTFSPTQLSSMFSDNKLYQQPFESWMNVLKILTKDANRQDIDAILQTQKKWFEETVAKGPAMANPNVLFDLMGSYRQWVENFFASYEVEGESYTERLSKLPNLMAKIVMGNKDAASDGYEMGTKIFQDVFGKYLRFPAANESLQQGIAQGFESFEALQQAYVGLLTEVHEAGNQAIRDTVADLNQLSQETQEAQSFADVYALWLKHGNAQFQALFEQPRYAELQKSFANSLMEYKIKEREITEKLLNQFPDATKSMADVVIQQLHSTQQDVQAIQQELKNLQTAQTENLQHALNAFKDELKEWLQSK